MYLEFYRLTVRNIYRKCGGAIWGLGVVQGGRHLGRCPPSRRFRNLLKECVCVGGGTLTSTVGALDGGHQCCMSILRNCTVTCLCHLFSSMSRFEFKKLLCHMSLHF